MLHQFSLAFACTAWRRARLLRFAAAFLALVAIAPGPAFAQLDAALGTQVEEAEGESAPSAEQVISDEQDEGADTRMAMRIRGIFSELPAFQDVKVTVRQGVVSLTGTVPETSDIARAAGIARRVSGVVTVDSALQRDLSLAASADTLGSLQGRLEQFVRVLPLVGIAVAVAFGIGLVGYALAGLTGIWHRVAPNSFLAELIASAIRFVFVVAGLIVGLNLIGAETLLGAVLGGAGLLGLALGFALRDTIENYVASLMLSVRQPFLPNDHVVIDSYEGRVIRLTSRATILMTLEGNHLRIPNSQVFKAVILNYTRNPQRRFQFDLGVDADDDALAARRLGRDTLKNLPFVLDDPAPEARVLEVGDSNVVLRFLGWIDQDESDWYKAQSLAIVAVKTALEEAGFGLPEPIYRLRFDPRSAAVPLPQGPAPAAPEAAAKPSPPSSVRVEAEDVRPTDEIRDMVEAERAATTGGKADLLDEARPVE
ncbi:mechanosensitive ion channel family protein [Novosphingobium mangrovi (ex Hu et al. 2023)]|uniref:Small-conductance mechanosensitive channel n=1 Tax=Novosphingobium mangrovi (ex Hu et al. 2023) TaxID=2930094 RepID=A0ABT0AG57_9SPHN|nr:mechanosensitive ion channel family protein [Novosphingobium mangrovi (ex Hu et al. 2023)]MCJ1962168.1 mechanosensitive ion channel family protein [Novosphingobium mangrovi (ex Hu et al. 2023)]